MDFDFALWQMLYLFYKPQNVYRNFQYRKVSWRSDIKMDIIYYFQETKAQFARDDPAFLVLLAALLLVSTVRSNKFPLSLDFKVFSRLDSPSSSEYTSGPL